MALRIERDEHIAIATIDREHARNALDSETRAELVAFWEMLDQDRSIRCAVLTGAGNIAFCAGSDLKDPALDADYVEEVFGGSGAAHFMAGMSFDTPLICGVNGAALGGGLELALACDIRIASTSASFGMPEVRIGSIPGAGGTQRLPRAIGSSDASYVLLTGEVLDAQQALSMRLVTECVAPGELLDRCVQVAQKIAANAPLSIRATTRMIRAASELPLATGLTLERMIWGTLKATDDRAEGRAAFRERRKPDFQGR